jgi:hypothetical protein
MAAPFLALITPLSSGAHPDHTLPIPPGPVDPGYSPPWARPPVDPGYGIDAGLRPTHPIYNPAYPDNTLPQPPLHTWGGGNVPMPSPPIYIPPDGAPPPLGIWGPPQMPPGFWGGGMGPGVRPQPPAGAHPSHPIVLPPDLPPETGEGGKIEWKVAWTPTTGWIVVGIPAEGTLVPTPSGGKP